MKQISSYDVKIKDYHRIFQATVRVYRQAVSFFLDICGREWEQLKHLNQNARSNLMERLALETKQNPDPKYDFNGRFYKMPAYLRRAAVRAAIGAYAAYDTALADWQENSERNRPVLQVDRNLMPVLYKGGAFVRTGGDTARIKIYHKNDWVWLPVRLSRQDVKYIRNHCSLKTELSPSLKRKGKRWYLSFPFETKMDLVEKPVSERIVCAVDLGLNHHAVCSVLKFDGTVMARKFIDFPIEKDHLDTVLNRIRKAQSHGAKRCPVLWKHAKDLNTEISRKTAGAILTFAKEFKTDVVVFEHLDPGGRKKGRRKQRLHLWKCREIQHLVEHKAHETGMRISRVCAWNTSRLAFDGSGRVERGTYMQNGKQRYHYSICVFPSGKTYHCDLNASYNIGARYFIRELLKSCPAMDGLPDGTKDSRYGTGSTRTLSTLISLNADLGCLSA